jgi:hypothetical protein
MVSYNDNNKSVDYNYAEPYNDNNNNNDDNNNNDNNNIIITIIAT